MSSRHQPEHGADSAEGMGHYRVFVEEELGGRFWVDIPAAYGPNDARNQAIEKAHDNGYWDVTALSVEEVMVAA